MNLPNLAQVIAQKTLRTLSNDSSLSRNEDSVSIKLDQVSPISSKQQMNFDGMARVHSCEYKHSSALGLVKNDELKMPN